MKKLILFAVLSLFLIKGHATDQFVFFQKETGYFTLINQCTPCRIVTDSNEDEGIRMAVENLKEDFSAYLVTILLYHHLLAMILFVSM